MKSNYNKSGFRFIWELGVGKTSPYTLITRWALPASGDAAIVATVLIANLPQALLSILYFIINGLITNLSLAEEWSRYARKRAALRVSRPHGSQRSTYFLQVPYRLGIPLMVLSSLLHWIISQSIFLVKVDYRDQIGGDSLSGQVGEAGDYGAITCGYSPLGMIVTVLAGFLLIVFAIALGCRRMKPGMPMAGSCSAAISAACHAPEGTSEVLPVIWGVIPGANSETEDHQIVGHCAFSNEHVEVPVEGHLYA